MNKRYIVAGVIQNGDQVVLGKKAKGRPPYPDVWHTPGGGVDDVEKARALFDAGDFDSKYFHLELRRELKEELQIEVKNITCIVPTYRGTPREGDAADREGNPVHFYFLEYLCDYAGGVLAPADDLVEAVWVKKEDLKNCALTPPSKEMYAELGWV